MERVIATPHIGYVTDATYHIFYRDAVEDIAAWLKGEPVREIAAELRLGDNAIGGYGEESRTDRTKTAEHDRQSLSLRAPSTRAGAPRPPIWSSGMSACSTSSMAA